MWRLAALFFTESDSHQGAMAPRMNENEIGRLVVDVCVQLFRTIHGTLHAQLAAFVRKSEHVGAGEWSSSGEFELSGGAVAVRWGLGTSPATWCSTSL